MTLLAIMASASSKVGANQRKIHGRGTVRVWKRITLVISNEVMDDIIKFMKALENSGVLIELVKQ